MGKLLIAFRYVFFLFSSDIHEARKHIHIRDRKGRITRLCKFWIEPKIELTYNLGFSIKEIKSNKKTSFRKYGINFAAN